jgi:hypothetical protein
MDDARRASRRRAGEAGPLAARPRRVSDRPFVLDTGRPAKANLSLDAGLLAAIDEAAAARGLTRSAFLASAARQKIESEG